MTQLPSLQIIQLNPSLVEPLTALFDEIQASGEAAFFHPHPFTKVEAERLCHYVGQDQYYVLLAGQSILGYSMLRGWDEGFLVPSLGIFIRAEARGQGLGRLMILHLHTVARLRQAPRIRLKVYRHNYPAKQMYEQFGYIFEDGEGEQLIGFYELSTNSRLS